MGGPCKLFLLAIALALPLSQAAAWTPETRLRMIDDAVRLMPESLRMALEQYREPLLRGMLDPMTGEDGPEHRPPWSEGTLDARFETEVLELIAAMRKPGPFGSVAIRLGRTAHWIADAGFPPGASREDGALRYAHFASFCESRREKFPLVFYGHDDPELQRMNWDGFALGALRLAADNDRELARAYAAAGEPPDPSFFDDRSVPFAVGSLSYSRSVTNIVRVWLAAWQQAEGDMGRTPYWNPAGTGNGQGGD